MILKNGFMIFAIALPFWMFAAIVYYVENRKNKLEKKISFFYDIGYVLKLQRTLFLCEYVLEILSQLRKNNSMKTKQILNALNEKGLRKYIDKNTFYYCDDMSFVFKDDDDLDIFTYNFQKNIDTIQRRLNSIEKNGFAYFHPTLELPWEIQVGNKDERFMPELPD